LGATILSIDSAGLWPVAAFGGVMAFLILLSGKKSIIIRYKEEKIQEFIRWIWE